MVKDAGAARRRAAAAIGRDPLEDWLEQERQALNVGEPGRPGPQPVEGCEACGDEDGAARSPGERNDHGEDWPAGWWLVPMMLAALPVWAVIGWWLLA